VSRQDGTVAGAWRPGRRSRVGARGRPIVDRLDAVASRIELPVLLAIIVTIPLEFTKLWFPVTALDVSRMGIIVSLAIVAVHLLAGTLRLRRSSLLLAIGLVTTIEIASFLATRWPLGTKEAVAIAAYSSFAVFVGHVLSVRDRLSAVALTLFASAVLVAVVGIAEELWNFRLWPLDEPDPLGRRSSTFGDPNIAARFLAMGLIVTLAILAVRRFRTRSGDRAWIRAVLLAVVPFMLATALMAVADILTLSRIGWLTAVLAIVLWVPMAIGRRTIGLGIAAFSLAFVGYLILVPSASHRAASVASDALTRIGAAGSSDEGELPPDLSLPADPTASTPLDPVIERLSIDSVRRYLIRAGVAMTIDHPVLGVGVGGFDAELRSEYWKYVPLDRRGSPTTLIHTDVMRVIAETGLVGLIGWCTLFATVLITAGRGFRLLNERARVAAYAAVTSIVVIGVASQFAGRFYTEPYLWLALGTLLAVPAMGSAPTPSRPSPSDIA
jgi:hypothetical protein